MSTTLPSPHHLFLHYIRSLTTFSSPQLSPQQRLGHLDVGLILALFAVKSGILTIFIYSYYGAHTTNNCLAFADIVYNSQWYDRLSLHLRKSLINVIFDAQRPLIFSGFGIVQLTLETFLAVGLLTFQTMKCLKMQDFRALLSISILFTDDENGLLVLSHVQDAHQINSAEF